jgi:hypothetical protein
MIGRWLPLSPRQIGGQPKSMSVSIPLAASLHGGGPYVIGGWYPPSEGRMGQCGPAFSVANPHACPGPFLGKLSGGNWMARGDLPAASAPGVARAGNRVSARSPTL